MNLDFLPCPSDLSRGTVSARFGVVSNLFGSALIVGGVSGSETPPETSGFVIFTSHRS